MYELFAILIHSGNAQFGHYYAYIKNFTDGSDIMTKTFYVVVPYEPAAIKVGNALPLFGGRASSGAPAGMQDSFDEYRVQLEQRMGLVASTLMNTGVRAVALGTEEIIELLYRSFNLGTLETPIKLAA